MDREDKGSEEESQVTSPDTQELATVEGPEPTPPQDMPDEECEEFRKRAKELVDELTGASGSKEMELIDSVTHVGARAQRSGGAELDLLRKRVGEMLSEGGTGNEIAKNLVNLRITLGQINPDELTKPGTVRRVLSVAPFISRLTPVLDVIEKIAIRYEPVSRQINMIESKLRESRMMLTKDNVELRQLYEQVEAQQFTIQKNAYLGELLMVELGRLLERTEDPLRVEKVRDALHDVSIRVQDLRTIEQVFTQFFVSIDMTRQNNNRLGQAVERTLTVATNVVMVGLAMQTALSRQKKIREVNERTREFIGDMLTTNAATIRRHTEEIGEVFNNPVIALDKITQAHNDLLAALDTADRLKLEGIESARRNIAKLSQMSVEMSQRAGALQAPEAEPKSIEA